VSIPITADCQRGSTRDHHEQSSSKKTRESQTAGGRNGGAVFNEGALLGSGMAWRTVIAAEVKKIAVAGSNVVLHIAAQLQA
jgi:hypothetical protein